jgi:hypothetical protein
MRSAEAVLSHSPNEICLGLPVGGKDRPFIRLFALKHDRQRLCEDRKVFPGKNLQMAAGNPPVPLVR